MASLLEGKDALGVRYLGAGGFFASEQVSASADLGDIYHRGAWPRRTEMFS